jgi:exodeoxyribonuclease VII large subunit
VQRRPPPTYELPFFDAPPVRAKREAPAPERQEPRAPAEPAALSVGELDRRLKRLVEGDTEGVHVEGEIVGLKEHGSGHAYFTLKDGREDASIDCVMFRSAPPRSRRLLSEGARVILIGRATVYAPRGKLQLTAEEARPVGRGALLEALLRLKEKLAGEGLFAEERKRPLPAEPRVIGVVTSVDGAAMHDIVTVAFRRAPVRILVASAPVQGAGAGRELCRALAMLAKVPEVEAIIIGRGGGSADDLAAFNDEALVRAIAACRVPVVSAVGHEIDMALTDLVADARAATPSQAAELLVPDARARAEAIAHLGARLRRAFDHRLRDARSTLERQALRLGSPGRLLAERRQTLDDARARLRGALRKQTSAGRGEVSRLERRLLARHPTAVLGAARAALGPQQVRLDAAMRARLARLRERLGSSAASLDALSPLAVLGRGYAIAVDREGRAILDADMVREGDMVRVRVHHGSFDTRVLGNRGGRT